MRAPHGRPKALGPFRLRRGEEQPAKRAILGEVVQ